MNAIEIIRGALNFRRIFLGMFLFALLPSLAIGQNKTPSHVYREAEVLVREIQLLRGHAGVTGQIRDPGEQFNKLPLHVYAKGLEVMDKIASFQKSKGMTPVSVPPTPLRKITPGDVFSLAEELLGEIVRVKSQLGVSEEITSPRFVGGKSPSDVYQNLWRASFAMDGLIPPLTPGHVFRNAEYVLAELDGIAQAMGRKVGLGRVENDAGRKITPKDVLVESFKNLYRIGKLQRQVGITPFTPPSFPIGKITPSDPYDATAMLLAELVRVKLKLGLTESYQLRELPGKKSPGDVFSQAKKIGLVLGELTQS